MSERDARGRWFERPLELLEILRALERRRVDYVVIGGLAAIIRGAPLPTYDLDIVPADEPGNRRRLAQALADLDAELLTGGARVRASAPDARHYVDAATLIEARSPFGVLDAHFRPAGTQGYRDLHRWATREVLAQDLSVNVAALIDVIRSKEAAGREEDAAALPALRATLAMSAAAEDPKARD